MQRVVSHSYHPNCNSVFMTMFLSNELTRRKSVYSCLHSTIKRKQLFWFSFLILDTCNASTERVLVNYFQCFFFPFRSENLMRSLSHSMVFIRNNHQQRLAFQANVLVLTATPNVSSINDVSHIV